MEVQWAQWPKNKLRPTREEYEEAERRYRATCISSDISDWGMGLEYVMSTCSIECWRDFFDSLK